MEYFKRLYRTICREMRILAEAGEKGLEFRQPDFFYDLQTKTYNQGFRNRFSQEERHEEELNQLGSHPLQDAVAIYFYILLHPMDFYKARRQIERSVHS